jgi:hypothetical protein
MKTLTFVILFFFPISLLLAQDNTNNTIVEIERNVFYMKTGIDSFEKVELEKTPNSHKYVYYNKSEPLIISFQKREKLEKDMDWYYFDKVLIYTETNWQDTTSGKILYTEKTYHHNGALIAWLNSESTFVDSNTPEYKSLERRLDTTAIHLREEVLYH